MSSVWEEVEIATSWGTIRGKKTGTGATKVLGVHGWLDNANTFDRILPLLTFDFTCISIDLPGHGKSDHFGPSFLYDPRGYVGAVKKVVDSLEWKEFVYLGHSMGAVVGIIYCSIFPSDVTSFISIDIIKVWSFEAEEYPQRLRKYFELYFDNEKKCSLPPLSYTKSVLIQKMIQGSGGSLDESSADVLFDRGVTKILQKEGKETVQKEGEEENKLQEKEGTVEEKLDQEEKFSLTRDLRAKVYFIGFTSTEGWQEFARNITCPLLIIKVDMPVESNKIIT